MARLLICGTNWLGDTIMSMPAVQALKQQNPALHVTLLVKPGMMPLWEMQPTVDALLPIHAGQAGTRQTVRTLRAQSYDRAVIFPNSFRSALLPFLGGIPHRAGTTGHWRRLLLTDARPQRRPDDTSHQAWEYFQLLGLERSGDRPPAPCLEPSQPALDEAEALLGEAGEGSWVGMLPGAARGDSKRWPPERFAAVAQRLVESTGMRIALFGTSNEKAACDRVSSIVGEAAVSFAGKTSLPVLAAALSVCRVVVSNDSGGMHLAASVGTPVVAVFGLTDPMLTGPLGQNNRVVCGGRPEQRTRDVPRCSSEAEAALRRVQPNHVFDEVRSILESS